METGDRQDWRVVVPLMRPGGLGVKDDELRFRHTDLKQVLSGG